MKQSILKKLKQDGFIPFGQLHYNDYEPYQKHVKCSDLTYAMLYAYDEFYPFMVKIMACCLVITGADENDDLISIIVPKKPENLPIALNQLYERFKDMGIELKISKMCEEHVKILENHPLVKEIDFDPNRSDYLYKIENYLTLEGGKNNRKRRDMNYVSSNYEDIVFYPLKTAEEFNEKGNDIFKILGDWCEGYDCDNCIYGCEKVLIRRVLTSPFADKLYGGIMYFEGKPEMFAIGEIIGDTYYLYYKKSAHTYQGTFYWFEYQLLQEISDVLYVNFEEDMGLPGLREYKRRRHPIRMIDKYDIILHKEK